MPAEPGARPKQPQEQAEVGPTFDASDAVDDEVMVLLVADAERIAAEAAVPLPLGARWSGDLGDCTNYAGHELEPHFAATTVIDAEWLLKLAEGKVMPTRKGVVPAWQQLPPEAKVSLTTLRKTTMMSWLPIAVLSYGWADPHHPDPTGALLGNLVPVLMAMVRSCSHGT